MTIEIQILDLGLNNVSSLCNAFIKAGATNPTIVSKPDDFTKSKLLVLPGVGSFGAAMEVISNRELDKVIFEHLSQGNNLLGICLGMQLLCSSSQESPGIKGLNLIEGKSIVLPTGLDTRVPHVGWEQVLPTESGKELFPSLTENLDFYFVHSYEVKLASEKNQLCTSKFGQTSFTSGIHSENIVGFQFHPEKSSKPGLQLLRNVLEWADG